MHPLNESGEEEGPNALYVHVADDGGIFVVDGPSGRSFWTTQIELHHKLQGLKALGGTVALTREAGTPIAERTLSLILETEVAVFEARAAHPDVEREAGVTTLMAASYGGALELVDDLLARGADVNAQDAVGYSALMFASRQGHRFVVHRLLEAGADPDLTHDDGHHALMYAAQEGHVRVATLLARACPSSVHRSDRFGNTAFSYARMNGHGNVEALLNTIGEAEA